MKKKTNAAIRSTVMDFISFPNGNFVQIDGLHLLFIKTCNAWLSGVPFSKWYGITVVKYFGSNPVVEKKNIRSHNLKLQFTIQAHNAHDFRAQDAISRDHNNWNTKQFYENKCGKMCKLHTVRLCCFALCFGPFLFNVKLAPFILHTQQ